MFPAVEVKLPFNFRETDSISLVRKMVAVVGEDVLKSTVEYLKESSTLSTVWVGLFDSLEPTVTSSITFLGNDHSRDAVESETRQEPDPEISLKLFLKDVDEPTEKIARQEFLEGFVRFAELYRAQLNY